MLEAAAQKRRPINGSNRKETLIGTQSDDVIFGNGGDDYIDGANGNDLIYGGIGNDLVWGNSGNDTIYGGDGNDSLHGGKGNDVIAGDDGNDVLYDHSGTNQLWGYEGNDTLILSGGNNIASGGNGNDRFSLMGRQNSTLAGGAGRDTYFFGIDVAGDRENLDPLTPPTGIFLIRDNFNEQNWGSIDLSTLNLEWINPTTGKRVDGGANTAKNDLWVSVSGSDVIYDIRYNDTGTTLKIILDGAAPYVSKIGSHVALTL